MKPQKLTTHELSRDVIIKRVARYKDLKGFSSGFDSNAVPNTERTLLNIMGNDAPKDGSQSPVGRDASKGSPIEAIDPVNIAYVRCRPGNGPLMHNHDTSETFIVMSGRWRFTWNEENPDQIELDQWDVVSFPPGVARRFENATFDEPDNEHLLMVIVGGTAPVAENTARAWETIERYTTV